MDGKTQYPKGDDMVPRLNMRRIRSFTTDPTQHHFIQKGITYTSLWTLPRTFSMSTASQMISATRSTGSLLTSFRKSRQAKSVCRPSSRLMSSFEKHSPGMRPLFLSQKTAQKLPEKKIPCLCGSTEAQREGNRRNKKPETKRSRTSTNFTLVDDNTKH